MGQKKKHKIGVHVNANARDNYGLLAPHANNVVTFDIAALREAHPDAVKIFRSQSEDDHKDAPGDFDSIPFSDLKTAARYWFDRMQPLFSEVRAEFPDVYIQFTNEINSPAPDTSKGETQPRILEYTQGLIDAAHEAGFKLALLGDAGGSPDWGLWQQYWLPFLVRNTGKDVIYNLHVYTKIGDTPLYLTKETVKRQVTHEMFARPFLVAQALIDAGCDIPILISELGWYGGWREYPMKWLADILRYNDLMLQYDNIIGGTLWTLGMWGDLRLLNGEHAATLAIALADEYEPKFWQGYQNQNPPVEPEPEPEPVDPPSSHNGDYIALERFQNWDWHDWYTPEGQRSNIQLPDGYDAINSHGDNPYGDGQPWNNFGYAEAVFMTTGHNLPPEEKDEYTLYESNEVPGAGVAYHLFANVPYQSILHRDVQVEAGKTYRLAIKAFTDFAFYNNGEKDTSRIDPEHAFIGLRIDGNEVSGVYPALRQHNTIYHDFTAGETGVINIGFELRSAWAMAPNLGVAGYFIQELSLQDITPAISDPDPEPVEETFLEFIVRVMQENQTQSLNLDAALQKQILALGWVPMGNESWTTHGTGEYATQLARSLMSGNEYVIYASVGVWDKIYHRLITPELEVSDTLIGHLMRTAREAQTQSLNRDAAIEKVILENGWLPLSNEKWETHLPTDRHVAIQGASDVATGAEFVLWSDVGAWDKVYVHQFKTGEVPPVEPEPEPVDPPVHTGPRPDAFNNLGYTEFIDVSHWNGAPDFGRLPDHVIGIIAKAAEGIGFRDSQFERNHNEAKRLGYLFGAYFFFRPGEDPVRQAQNFAQTLNGYDHVHFIVVDVEKRLQIDNDEFYDQQLKVFIDNVQWMLGMKPWIYTGWNIWIEMTTNPSWAKEYPLWIAHYGVDKPLVPAPWTPEEWKLWQYTSSNTSYFGWLNYLDVNHCKMTRYEFLNFCQSLVTENDFVLWLNEPNAPVEPQPTNRVDLRPYIFPENGDSGNYIVETVSGPHTGASEVFRTTLVGDVLKIAKNELAEWYVRGTNYLFSDRDISPAPDSSGSPRYYLVREEYGSNRLKARFPLDLYVGELWVGTDHWVQFFHKITGNPLPENSGWAINSATLKSVGRWTHPVTGKTFDDVAIIDTGHEIQVFMRGVGLVAWVSPWGSSQLADDQGNVAEQPPKQTHQVAEPRW